MPKIFAHFVLYIPLYTAHSLLAVLLLLSPLPLLLSLLFIFGHELIKVFSLDQKDFQLPE